jgi:hypothetical protein
MHQVVDKLGVDDMLAIAAYVGSRALDPRICACPYRRTGIHFAGTCASAPVRAARYGVALGGATSTSNPSGRWPPGAISCMKDGGGTGAPS